MSKATPGLRQRKQKMLRELVLSIAGKFFEKQGFIPTTISQICEEAMISEPTFHRHFSSKNELYILWARSQGRTQRAILEEILGPSACRALGIV